MLPVSLFGNYAIDLSLMKELLMDPIYSTLYMRSEIYNQGKGIRPNVGAPTDLERVLFHKPTVFELVFNEHTVNSLFSSLAESKDFTVTLTDSIVNKYTGFLHLRTSDFRFYIPGLMKFGDVPMELVLSYYQAPPAMKIIEGGSEIKIAGTISAEFIVNKVSAVKLGWTGGLALTASLDAGRRDLSAKLKGIELSKVDIISCSIDRPDVNVMLVEFNTLFKFVTNGLNIYLLDQPIHIPEEINLGFAILKIKEIMMKVYNGAFAVAADLLITE